MTGRDQLNFVPHVRGSWSNPETLMRGVTNLIHESDNPKEQWIVATTNRIGDWRSMSRSTYMRWALAINGMLTASERYKDWKEDQRFQIKSLRPSTREPREVVLAEWSGEEAVQNHIDASHQISAYGVCDLYGCLEEMAF